MAVESTACCFGIHQKQGYQSWLSHSLLDDPGASLFCVYFLSCDAAMIDRSYYLDGDVDEEKRNFLQQTNLSNKTVQRKCFPIRKQGFHADRDTPCSPEAPRFLTHAEGQAL